MTQSEVNKLAITIEHAHTKNELQGLTKGLMPYLKMLESSLYAEKISAIFFAKTYTSLTCNELAKCIIFPFVSEKIYEEFRALLNEEQRKIWDYLVLNGSISTLDIKRELGIDIFRLSPSRPSEVILASEYSFLPYFKPYSSWGNQTTMQLLSIHPELAKIGRELYKENPFLKMGFIKPVPQEIKAKYMVSFEDKILADFSNLFLYYTQGNINVTAKNYINQTGLNKLNKTLKIAEFFPDASEKNIKLLRTYLLASLMLRMPRKSLDKPIESYIKDLFWSKFKEGYEHPIELLYYLKNITKLGFSDVQKDNSHYWQFLKKALNEKWQSAENLFHEFTADYGNVAPIKDFYNNLYYDFPERGYGSPTLNKYNVRQTAGIPVFKGCLFMFAAYGLVEIAYNEVDMSKWGVLNFSPYDHIQYVRLTALGAYILDFTDKYVPAFQLANNKFSLSETNLHIIIEEEVSPQATQMLLADFSKKISPKRYSTDYQTFLKGCLNSRVLQMRINSLSALVNKEIPKHWLDFFAELKNKVNPIKAVSDFFVYQIPANNTTIIQLISKDEELRKYVFRAEGFFLLIHKDKLEPFKKRLQEFGYLLLD